MSKLTVYPENATTFWDWLQNRGGILVWSSVDLCDLGWSCSTPAKKPDGSPTTKPHWKAGENPRLIVDPNEVEVIVPKEVKRFHVATRVGASGTRIKLTDASSNKLRNEVRKAKEKQGNAWYEFDYGDYKNAVIFTSAERCLLSKWIKTKGESANDRKDESKAEYSQPRSTD
jgi:hypothetical protein